MPKLAALEHKYGEDGSSGFVVVGVHSAKYTAEHESRNIAAAVARLNITHPVLNDDRMELWNKLGIRGWPSFALVSPQGMLIAQWSGERQEHDIDQVVSAALEYYKDDINHQPLPVAPKRSVFLPDFGRTPLRYPSKILLDSDGKALYVADSGNNRILKYNASTGAILASYGSGNAGFVDSANVSDASFHFPQGLALWKDKLYVADTENHAVRMIDLTTGSLRTIGGNGEQGFDFAGGKTGREQLLSSPWDLEIATYDAILYVAMAGIHQIWCVDIGKNDYGAASPWNVFSGTGRELEKNSSVGRTASWSQPSHLSIGFTSSSSRRTMYVADSESSTVRSIDIDPPGGSHSTRTLAGGDGLLAENMFAFGDKDGKGAKAKFQHPLAVLDAKDGKNVYVADSYNHRIKVVDIDGNASAFVGSGKPGLKDGSDRSCQFWEPSGLALSPDGSLLYVCDCNNSVIRVVDTKQRSVSTLKLDFPSKMLAMDVKSLVPYRDMATVRAVSIGPTQNSLSFEFRLPKNATFVSGMANSWQVNEVSRNIPVRKLADGAIALKEKNHVGVFQIFHVDIASMRASAQLEVETMVHYCSRDDGICNMESNIFKLIPSTSDTTAVVAHVVGESANT